MPADEPAVVVRGLTVSYGGRRVVDGVDLVAERGSVVAVLGPNGAGKTTTVETVEGYRRPDGGQISVLGLDPGRRADRRRLVRRIGVMLQEGGVYPAMSPAEALALFAAYHERPVPPRELLGRLGLEGVAATPWRRLSGGEQQRLSLALALVGRPEVAFLDEPTAGVDPAGRAEIRAEIIRLRDEGACVLLTTHELGEAERLADRIAVLHAGRVVASGTAAELAEAAGEGARMTVRARPGLDVAALGAAAGGTATEALPGEYEIDVPGSPATVAAVTAWLDREGSPLYGLRTGSGLEEVFLRLTGEDR